MQGALRRIIVNADDFGRHVLINRAVERGVAGGVLRSATLMPGGAAFDDAVLLARRTPALGVGIHLTLVNGNPVLPPGEIPSLVTPEGVFHDHHTDFAVRILRGQINLDEVRAELAAQLRRVEAAGIRPTHAGIPAMRAPRAPLFAGAFGGVGQFIGRAGLAVLARRAAAKARRRGIRTPEHFAGIVAGEAVDTETLTAIVRGAVGGVTEVMMHPGTDNAALIPACLWDHDFEAELAALCAPAVQDVCRTAGAEPVNFRIYEADEGAR